MNKKENESSPFRLTLSSNGKMIRGKRKRKKEKCLAFSIPFKYIITQSGVGEEKATPGRKFISRKVKRQMEIEKK